jgi:signal recognition particle subunit SRP54
MGDVKGLLEHAEAKIKESDQQSLYNAMQSGRFTLEDFAQQMGMLSKLGSLTQVARYLPGVNLSKDMIEQGEVELKRFKAIISSMTKKERLAPKILDGSRKKRISLGAGVAVADINRLLERFEESQQYAKLFKKMSGSKGFFK